VVLKKTVAALLALAAMGGALAADLPKLGGPLRTKPITIVVPFTHGGPTDELARVLADAMGRALKQKVIEVNVRGAGGTLGTARAARAAPDGTTLLLSNIGHATAAALHPKLAYDPVADFEPIGLVADVPMTLVGRAKLPAADLEELVMLAQATKGGLSYGHAGAGSASHLCGVMLMRAMPAEFTSVPYQGTQETLLDLAGGHIDLMCDQPTNTLAAIRKGQIKAYAVTGARRLDVLPSVPTMHEAGLPGVELQVWHGLYAPKGTPEPVVARLADGLRQALKDPQVRARFAALGAQPVPPEEATPGALRAKLKSEVERWRPVVEKVGVLAR